MGIRLSCPWGRTARRRYRTGAWFYLGAILATLGIGIAAAFVVGDAFASHKSSPKTWVAVLDLVGAGLLLAYVVKTRNRPMKPEKVDSMVAHMEKVTSSPAIAIVGAGAVLANPGAFVPFGLKAISETDPTTLGFIGQWAIFSFVSLLPLGIALVLLLVARDWAEGLLGRVRGWLIGRMRTVFLVLLVLLAAVLLRHGLSAFV